jgi:hypothetical protein
MTQKEIIKYLKDGYKIETSERFTESGYYVKLIKEDKYFHLDMKNLQPLINKNIIKIDKKYETSLNTSNKTFHNEHKVYTIV